MSTASALRAHIPRTRQVHVGKEKPYVGATGHHVLVLHSLTRAWAAPQHVYDVVLARGLTTWTVVRRFSEFHALHQRVRAAGAAAFSGAPPPAVT